MDRGPFFKGGIQATRGQNVGQGVALDRKISGQADLCVLFLEKGSLRNSEGINSLETQTLPKMDPFEGGYVETRQRAPTWMI